MASEAGTALGRRERLLALGVVLALLGAGCGGGGKLGAKALSQQSKALQSLAAEGALLAQDAVSGKTTRIYTREHSADLYKAASQAEASLKAARSEPALEPKLRRLALLASRDRADLKRLGDAYKEEALALGRELQTAAEESQKISDGPNWARLGGRQAPRLRPGPRADRLRLGTRNSDRLRGRQPDDLCG